MKRITLLFVAFFLIAFTLGAQEGVDEQMAVAMQVHNLETLMNLGLTRNQAEELQTLHYELQERQRELNLEANVVRAQIARMLNAPDADQNEVNKLLEQHNRLRLMREKEQVGYYYEFRARIGERQWQELVRTVRNQNRNRVKDQSQPSSNSPAIRSGSSSGGSSGSPGGPGN